MKCPSNPHKRLLRLAAGLCLLPALCHPDLAYGQRPVVNAAAPCGTVLSREVQVRFLETPQRAVPIDPVTNKATSVAELKIQFHVVCNGTTPPISAGDVATALAHLNTKFAPSGLSFVQCSAIDYIYNTPFGTNFTRSEIDQVKIGAYDRNTAINVYIYNQIESGDIGGFSYVPGDVSYGYINTYSHSRVHVATTGAGGAVNVPVTLVHEMGHFFGLQHTHGSGAAGTTNETVYDALGNSNGAFAGDGIFDTPADPAITAYLTVGSPCIYPNNSPTCATVPNFCDVNGRVYAPLTDNAMFFKSSDCNTNLTNGQAQQIYSTYIAYHQGQYEGAADIISRDDIYDPGYEPNITSNSIYGLGVWESPDIWNCRSSNSCTTHEKPGYGTPNKNSLRLRIKNNGCENNQQGMVRTYWTYGSTGETWPGSWNSKTLCSYPAGDEIPNLVPIPPANIPKGQVLPVLTPGQETILTYDWIPEDPFNPTSKFSCVPGGGLSTAADGNPMICFLGRIDAFWDHMHSEQNGPISHNVTQNNNIVTRNTSLVNLPGHLKQAPPFGNGGSVFVESPLNANAVFDLHVRDISENAGTFANSGIVYMRMSDNLWDAWMDNGHQGDGVEIFDEGQHRVAVSAAHGVLRNIQLVAGEVYQTSFTFDLRQEVQDYTESSYALYQSLSGGVDTPVGSACIFHVVVDPDLIDGQKMAPGSQSASVTSGFATLYPNPATNTANLKFNLDKDGPVDIVLTDMNGKTVAVIARGEKYAAGTHTRMLNLDRYASGIYLLQVHTAGGQETLRFHIQKEQ